MSNNGDCAQMADLSVDQLKSLEWDTRHEVARGSVAFAAARARCWAIDDEAHRRGTCLHGDSICCTSLEHGDEREGTAHRWRHEIKGRLQEWSCSRCHLWLVGLPQAGKMVFQAVFLDGEFSRYVTTPLIKGGRDLLFSPCDPAEGRRQLAAAAREHLAMYERRDEAQAVTEGA